MTRPTPVRAHRREEGSPRHLRLRLYVAGQSPNSLLAIANLRAALALPGAEAVAYDVVDVLEHPDVALRDGVLVTPTLVKLAPSPEQRVVGNLKNRSVLLALLGFAEAGP